ncbi:MAG: chitosanase [Ruminococcus sp.]|nr:MAG: chitosanase [Ruminococcus sp.]
MIFLTRITPLQYGYFEDIGDGRGYTARIIGFTTGIGDLPDVVELSC